MMIKNILKVLVPLTIIVLGIFCFYAYKIFFKPASKDLVDEEVTLNETGQEKPAETESLDKVNLELADYLVYKIDGIPFNFIIAKLRITNDGASNISLSNITTSEDISLDKVDTYISKLEEKQYYLGRQNVVYDLISNENQFFANIFIPVINKSSKEVSIKFNNQEIKFDMNKKAGDISKLSYKAQDIITDGKTYQMQVSEAYNITGDYMYERVNNQELEYLLPSTVEVYAFKLDAVSLWNDIIEIESGQYVSENGQVFEALEANVYSEKFENILSKKISEKISGYMFFIAYNPIDNPITYKGVLKLKVKGSDTWIVVNVDLN